MKESDFIGNSESFRKLNPHLFGVQRVSDAQWECAESERKLQDEIHDICARNRWLDFRSRMDMPTTGRVGQPDFIIARKGDILFVECKSAKGKLRPDQIAVKAWLSTLGHEMHVVRSVAEFEEVAR